MSCQRHCRINLRNVGRIHVILWFSTRRTAMSGRSDSRSVAVYESYIGHQPPGLAMREAWSAPRGRRNDDQLDCPVASMDDRLPYRDAVGQRWRGRLAAGSLWGRAVTQCF